MMTAKHLAPHYIFQVKFDNSKQNVNKTVNLYDGVKKFKIEKIPLYEFDNIRIGLVRLIVSDSEFMPTEKELDAIFPLRKRMHEPDLGDYYLYKSQYQPTLFEWINIDIKLEQLKNKNITVPKGADFRFVFFAREASIEDLLEW